MLPLRLALIGAGQRGADVYGAYALHHPDEIRFVAVAEPVSERRERCAEQHDLPAENVFRSWQDLLARPQLADAVIVATQDQNHVEPTLAALHAGYNVLLEKPMATTLDGCISLVHAAEAAGVVLQICHVLRYTPFFSTIYDIVQSGRLGDIVTVEHRENVSYWHMAHSYVRGNWRNKALSSPMILAKCCHDLDLLYWILGQNVTRLSSVGSLRHYRADQAPHPDVPLRCTDGCPVADHCPFYAPSIYLEHRPWGNREMSWPMSTLANGDLSHAAILQALQEGPYGRCVYHCDNDVVDNQIVTMETEAHTSIALFMHGHSHEESRTMRYDGTRATLSGLFTNTRSEIRVHDHLTNQVEIVQPLEIEGGHGGGDTGLIAAFIQTLRGNNGHPALTSARASLESHLLAFAAEQARQDATVLDMTVFRAAAL